EDLLGLGELVVESAGQGKPAVGAERKRRWTLRHQRGGEVEGFEGCDRLERAQLDLAFLGQRAGGVRQVAVLLEERGGAAEERQRLVHAPLVAPQSPERAAELRPAYGVEGAAQVRLRAAQLL